MKYFRALCRGDYGQFRFGYRGSCSLRHLYEEFDKDALFIPYSVWQDRNNDDEEGRIFGVSVALKDPRKNDGHVADMVRKACSFWDLKDPWDVVVSECTYDECLLDLSKISDTSEVESKDFRMLNLEALRWHVTYANGKGAVWERPLIDPLSKEDALSLAQDGSYAASLAAELKRIYDQPSCSQKDHSGLPVHYLIEGTNPTLYEPTLNVLLGALVQTGRIPTRNVFHFDVDDIKNLHRVDSVSSYLDTKLNDAFVEALKGNTLIVQYGPTDDEANYDEFAYATFSKLVDLLNPRLDDIQVVFLVPPHKAGLKTRLARRFAGLLVELSQDPCLDIRATRFKTLMEHLQKRACDEGLEPDEHLEDMLQEDLRNKTIRSVDETFERWRRWKRASVTYPQYLSIAEKALEERKVKQDVSAIRRLDELVGLEEVKQHIKNVVMRIGVNDEIARAGLPPRPFSLHLAFVGSPGTGKTEVARLYGEMLKEAGILSEGRVISVTGSSMSNVKDVFKRARGSVLFVDEAYGMLESPMVSITEFIACMENQRDDTVVVLAGYEHLTERLIRSNPGFRSRLGDVIRFPDYSADELLEIFKLMCDRANLLLPEETLRAARDILSRSGRSDDQGNARYVRKLFEDALGAQQVRLAKAKPQGGFSKKELQTLLPQDIGWKPSRPSAKSARQEFNELIGLTGVKKLVSDRLDFAALQKIKRDAGVKAESVPLHLAFKGNPGTGKTEVARLIGRILKEEGVLSVGDFFECGRQDLVGLVVGSTAPKVEDLFRRAKGSVIFIDEAYSLNDGQKGGYGDEAITAIVDQMEKLRDDVVVIFAGYSQDMDDFLKANAGLRSRVSCEVTFPDYTTDELMDILDSMARSRGLHLERKAREKAHDIICRASRGESFGNARFVRTLLESAMVSQGARLCQARRNDAGKAAGDEDASLTKRALTTLISDDFQWSEPEGKKPFGFVNN